MHRRAFARRSIIAVAMTLATLAWTACKSSDGGAGGAIAGGGGPVSGPADMHCNGMTPQPTNQASCNLMSDGGAGDGSSDYGATMFGSEADDDDCKYHVSWTSSAIAENYPVTFTLTGTYLADGMPNPPACKGCPIQGLESNNFAVEVFLNDTHPGPPTSQVTTPGATGTYAIGPILFDAPGQWTVRFHLFELCSDVTSDSQHGHAAFFVDVP